MNSINDQLSTKPAIVGNNMLAAALTSPALEWQSDRGGRMNFLKTTP